MLLSSIYPKEMVINCTNVSPRKCHYLDMSISIYKGKFRVTLYDKRKDFSFNVISYPFLDGNIPTSLSYGVFVSQLVRFVNVNSTFEGFKSDVASLVSKLVCQGFNLAALRKKFIKFYNCKLNLWSKFGLDIFDTMICLFNWTPLLYLSHYYYFIFLYYVRTLSMLYFTLLYINSLNLFLYCHLFVTMSFVTIVFTVLQCILCYHDRNILTGYRGSAVPQHSSICPCNAAWVLISYL